MRGALTLAILCVLLLIATRPAQAQTENVLYSFGAQAGDGNGPLFRLTPDGAGNFYGTTAGSPWYTGGTVFELSPNGGGGLKRNRPLHLLLCPELRRWGESVRQRDNRQRR